MTNITPLDFDPNCRDRERRLYFHDPETGAVGEYEGIGAEFSAARRQAGLDITHVATSLRIRQEHLAAIEDGRFADLPAPAYAVGFVRSYAEFLGMDSGAAIQAFKDETENSRERISLIFPTADAEDRVPRGWFLGMSAALALVIFGAWFYSRYSDLILPERVPPAPAQTVETPAAAPAGPIVVAPGNQRAPEPAPNLAVVQQPVPATNPVPELEVAAVPEVEDVPFAAGIEAALAVGAADGAVAQTPVDQAAGRVLGVIPVDPNVVGALAAGEVAVGDVLPDPAPVQNVDALPALAEVERANDLPQLVPLAAPEPAVAAPLDAVAARAAVVAGGAGLENAPAAIPAPAPQAVVAAEAPVVAAPEPEPVVAPEPEPVAPEPVVAPEPEVEVAVLPPPAAEPAAPAPAVAAAIPAPAVPPAAPEVAGLPGLDPQIFGEEVAGRVVILARQDSWVQITGTAGELLLTRILRAGDRYLAPDREDLILMTGNAGALEITVDGVQIAPLGLVGTVRRNVSLAPDRLLAGGR